MDLDSSLPELPRWRRLRGRQALRRLRDPRVTILQLVLGVAVIGVLGVFAYLFARGALFPASEVAGPVRLPRSGERNVIVPAEQPTTRLPSPAPDKPVVLVIATGQPPRSQVFPAATHVPRVPARSPLPIARAQVIAPRPPPAATRPRIVLTRPRPTITPLLVVPTRPPPTATPVPPTPAPPSPTPSPSASGRPTPSPTPLIHTVQAGQNLFMIAQRYGVSVAALVAGNRIADPNMVQPGTELVIPTQVVPTPPALLIAPTQRLPTITPLLALPTRPPSTPTPVSFIHTVQPGENLSIIALRYGVTVRTLVERNGIGDPNLVQPGVKLVIPTQLALRVPSVPAIPTPPSLTHTVQPGETLWSIAAQYGVHRDVLAAENGISDPNLIRAGMELVIPSQVAPTR